MSTDTNLSPKKRSLMPSSGLRRALRGHGHALSPTVQVGKSGVTGGLIRQVQQALADHELIKIKIGGESPTDRYAVAERLAAEPGVSIVQVLGRVILAYKRHPSTPRYEGKRAKVTPGGQAATATAKGKRKGEVTKAEKPPRRLQGESGRSPPGRRARSRLNATGPAGQRRRSTRRRRRSGSSASTRMSPWQGSNVVGRCAAMVSVSQRR